jgi:hypothetical protein
MLLTGFLVICILSRKYNFEAITYNDGLFYDSKIKPEYYFIKRINGASGNPNLNDTAKASHNVELNVLPGNRDINSSRPFNEVPNDNANIENNNDGGGNILVLKDNPAPHIIENGLEKDVEKGADEEPQINNNYLDRTVGSENKEKDKRIEKADNENVTEYKWITYHDYKTVVSERLFSYDNRRYLKYVKDELVQHHSLVKVILKRSLVEPYYIVTAKFLFKINIICFLNAICLIDSLIENRASNPSRVNLSLTIE